MMFRNEVIDIGGWDYAIYLLATEDIFNAVIIFSNPVNNDFILCQIMPCLQKRYQKNHLSSVNCFILILLMK